LLIVDDNADAAEMLAVLLRNKDLVVRTAYGGEQGLEISMSFKPDVIILDLTMPRFDGFQLASRLRAMPEFKKKHFIALTAHDDQSHLDQASRAQFDDYMVKPCKVELLMKILAEVEADLKGDSAPELGTHRH
jgi:CheY-like chemotaxis protein